MSDDGFLKRWSRRKRGAALPAEPPAPDGASAARPPSNPSLRSGQALRAQAGEGISSLPPRSDGGREGAAKPAPAPSAEPDEIDPAMLPPLESLGPDSDYTVFLKRGVPEALRVAALRKAWMSDPFIRDFRGPAEYAIDYTTAEFDLRPTDDVAKLLDRIFPATPEPVAGATPPSGPPADDAAPPREPMVEAPRLPHQQSSTPPQPDRPAQPESRSPIPRRRHGGALPASGEE